MPSAGGEVIYGAKGFLPYINAGCVDIVMPDVKYCGGILELKKIASLAEAAGLNDVAVVLRRPPQAQALDILAALSDGLPLIAAWADAHATVSEAGE